AAASPSNFAFHGHYIVPGFIDVHVHGLDGIDSLSSATSVADIAARMPRFGVTGFCPTTVACSPARLRGVPEEVRRSLAGPDPQSARVLPAHLESNFINPEYKGAQPIACLRSPRLALAEREERARGGGRPGRDGEAGASGTDAAFDAADVLTEIERGAPD